MLKAHDFAKALVNELEVLGPDPADEQGDRVEGAFPGSPSSPKVSDLIF